MGKSGAASSAPFRAAASSRPSSSTSPDMRPSREDSALLLFTKKALIVAALIVALSILFIVRNILILVFIAGVLAAGISPAVHWVRVRYRFWFHRPIDRGKAV